MRPLLSGILFLVSATFAQAEIQPEDLRELAYKREFQGVEAAMAEAHQQSLTGEIRYDDLRDLLEVLTRTHPDMDDFRVLWLEKLPTSPYAQMATAWSLYNDSFAIRGEALARETPRPAMQAFSRMQNEAMQLALSAYDTAPDFVPASDGIIRMQLTTKTLWSWMIRSVIANTMTTTPNFGSLLRASYLSNPRWGGAGQQYNVNLCDNYFDRIPEYPDLTKDACIVSLLHANDQLDGNWDYVAEVLDQDDHELLIGARVSRALERRTDEDRQIIMNYLRTVSFDDPWITYEFRIARRFAGRERGYGNQDVDAFFDALQIRIRAELTTELERNPYHLPLLRIVIENQSYLWTLIQSNTLELHNYSLRKAVIQPYHARNWTDANDPYAQRENPTVLNTFDTPNYNAVVYSDHSVFAITNFLQPKLEQYRRFRDPIGTLGFLGWPEPTEEELISEIGCRVATLIRLFDDAAKRYPESLNFIEGFRINQNLNEIKADLRTLEACDYVWDATIEDLRFDPIEIDRRSLLVIPESSPFAPSLEMLTQSPTTPNP